MSFLWQLYDTVRLLPVGGPGICSVMLTNACNANCDFCGYARDKTLIQDYIWMDPEKLYTAIDILYDRGVRYLSFLGGEPTLHPKLCDIVSYAFSKKMRPAVVTNGSRLTTKLLTNLKESGLKTLYISIDSPIAEEHEKNRGLPEVWNKIIFANQECKKLGMKTIAIVTINKMIKSIATLIQSLKELGFDTVTFSYPKKFLGSSHLSCSEESTLIDYTSDELTKIFEEIQNFKSQFAILNPRQSLLDMIRFLREENQVFPCYGGYKYFYLDYHFDLYRCDYWSTKISSVFEFQDKPFVRDDCTLCMNSCYRDSSVMLHSSVSIGDAIYSLKKGNLAEALIQISKKTNVLSIKGLLEDRQTLRKLGRIDAK